MGKECKQHAAPLRTARNILIFLEKTNKQTTTTKLEYTVAWKQIQCFRLQYLSFYYFCFYLFTRLKQDDLKGNKNYFELPRIKKEIQGKPISVVRLSASLSHRVGSTIIPVQLD